VYEHVIKAVEMLQSESRTFEFLCKVKAAITAPTATATVKATASQK